MDSQINSQMKADGTLRGEVGVGVQQRCLEHNACSLLKHEKCEAFRGKRFIAGFMAYQVF